VVGAEQGCDLDRGTDLFEALTSRCGRRILVVVDKAARQAPLAVARLDGAPAEHHTAVVLDDHRGGDLRVAPEDEVVVGTGLELAALDDPHDQGRAAVDAEVGHFPGL